MSRRVSAIIAAMILMCAGGVSMCAAEDAALLYAGKDKGLPVTITYPVGWKAGTQKGMREQFTQAVFVEQAHAGKPFGAVIAFKQSPSSRKGLATLKKELIARLAKRKAFKVVNERSTTMLSQPALEITVAYHDLDSYERMDAKLIPLQETFILTKNFSAVFTASYLNTAGDFERLKPVFTQMMASAKLDSPAK